MMEIDGYLKYFKNNVLKTDLDMHNFNHKLTFTGLLPP